MRNTYTETPSATIPLIKKVIDAPKEYQISPVIELAIKVATL